MNDKGFKVAGHPRHKGLPTLANSIDQTYYIVSQTLGFGLPLKFPTFGSMVVHVDLWYYKYMYIEGKSVRYLVNYKNFVLDHFNYNEFLNF